jgi:hypothetical protein
MQGIIAHTDGVHHSENIQPAHWASNQPVFFSIGILVFIAILILVKKLTAKKRKHRSTISI